MKRVSIFIFIALAIFSVACNSYLDINTNPNVATTVTPNLVLPQALVATAAVLNRYNTYGSQIGGYAANAGGFGGFNELVSYAYTSNNYNDLWPYTYDNLEDYQYVINTTATDAKNIYFNAAATIMRVHNFQLLVDAFNDVPYSKALKGADNLTPAYDNGSDIYAALAVELDSAMARINRGNAMAAKNPITNYDVLFHGDMTKWLQLANTIKLRLLVRGNGKVTFANNTFDPAGFLTTDAMINPGYTRDNNRQNPAWNTWAFAYTGSAGNKAWVPTTWIVSFYDGTNLADTKRGSATYYQFGVLTDFGAVTGGNSYTNGTYTGVSLTGGNGTGAKADITVSGNAVTKVALTSAGSGYYPSDILSAPAASIGGTGTGFSVAVKVLPISNVLGFENVSAPKCPTGSRWYPGTDRGGTSAGNATGPLKGPNAGYPVVIAAESYFLQAEAAVKGIVAGSASTLFNKGITAAFEYAYLKADGSYSGDYTADAASYITANTASYLANFSLATTADLQTEAIITQKYIALNFVNSHEGWNEYRRTGYPKVSGSAATTTFASIASQSTRPDKLPTRILYPNSEAQYNPANQPTGISPFTSVIFWAK